jgi:hypothetical protein
MEQRLSIALSKFKQYIIFDYFRHEFAFSHDRPPGRRLISRGLCASSHRESAQKKSNYNELDLSRDLWKVSWPILNTPDASNVKSFERTNGLPNRLRMPIWFQTGLAELRALGDHSERSCARWRTHFPFKIRLEPCENPSRCRIVLNCLLRGWLRDPKELNVHNLGFSSQLEIWIRDRFLKMSRK